MMSDENVTLTLVDDNGNNKITVPVKKNESILEALENAQVEFPYSCRAGACVTCLAKVESGLDCVDIGKISVPLVDIESDEVLTCIGGIKDSCYNDGKSHNVVIKQMT